MLRALLACCLGSTAWALSCYDGQGGFMQADWSFCEALTPTILMYYGPQGDFVRLGLFIEQHSGWSALAFGGNGGMKGAQQFVVRKVDGAFVAEERYSTDYVTPALQPTQEVALIFANEESGNTAWGILIPKSTCNAGERYPVEDFSRFMHWALGSSHEFLYHTSRGQFHANLLTGPMTLEDFSNAKNVSFEMPNVPVVMGAGGHDEKNPYVCGMFDLSQMLPSAARGTVMTVTTVTRPSARKTEVKLRVGPISHAFHVGGQRTARGSAWQIARARKMVDTGAEEGFRDPCPFTGLRLLTKLG